MINTGIDKVNIGEFVNKVTILRPVNERTERGALKQTWEKLSDVYGKLVINGVDETMVDQNIVNPDKAELTTYVNPNVTSECRMVIEGQPYNITSVVKAINQPIMVVRGQKITENV